VSGDEISKNPSDDLPNQEESKPNCLLIGNRGFIYKREK